MLSADRRTEIATFLRNRRERLQPEQVGMPRGSRRRTPGLRREEVAALADISTEWYTRLEQARNVNPSRETLQAISVALRLEPAERKHLLALSGHGAEPAGDGGQPVVSANLQRLMDQLDYCPAWILGARWDFLAWNRAATVIHGDLAALSGIERNGLYQFFLGTRMRRMLVDWEMHGRDCVAKLRMSHARHVDDPWFNELIEVLREGSPEFAAWWDEHNVQLPRDGVKAYRHLDAGRLVFDYTVMEVTGSHVVPLNMISYVPREGSGTTERMQQLLAGMPEPGPADYGAGAPVPVETATEA